VFALVTVPTRRRRLFILTFLPFTFSLRKDSFKTRDLTAGDLKTAGVGQLTGHHLEPHIHQFLPGIHQLVLYIFRRKFSYFFGVHEPSPTNSLVIILVRKPS